MSKLYFEINVGIKCIWNYCVFCGWDLLSKYYFLKKIEVMKISGTKSVICQIKVCFLESSFLSRDFFLLCFLVVLFLHFFFLRMNLPELITISSSIFICPTKLGFLSFIFYFWSTEIISSCSVDSGVTKQQRQSWSVSSPAPLIPASSRLDQGVYLKLGTRASLTPYRTAC